MRILFYINSLRHGGAERVMTNLANKFSESGNECILVTSFKADNEYETSKNVKRIVLFDEKIKGRIKRNLKLIRKLRKTVKQERADVVLSFMAEPNFRSIIACFGLKCKNIISVRNDPEKEYGSFISRFLAKRLFSFSDGVVFQTSDARAWFPKRIQKKSRIIYNQVDSRFYETSYDGARKNIVTTGRLTSQKNQEMLIRAFSVISDKVKDNLIIYGEGELREKLEKLVSELNLSDRVSLPGVVSDVPNAIKSARLFVLSSDYEGMPNALMEAMALGVPCISTDCPCGGPRELFGAALTEQLVPVADEKTLSKKMLDMLNADDRALSKVSHDVSYRAENFKGDIIFEEWKKYIESVYLTP